MPIDRNYQLKVLEAMYQNYPSAGPGPRNAGSIGHFGLDPDYSYLIEHGLVRYLRDEQTVPLYRYFITSKGIDFLENDGGLSAILNVVTVRLHQDSLAALLKQHIDTSDLPPTEKAALSKKLETLSDEGSKHLLTKALDYGLSNAPNAISWISELVKSL